MEEITPYTKYTLLTSSAYLILNEQISKELGYDIANDTARYTDVVPNLAKVNIQVVNEVETYDTKAVMMLTVEVQELCTELLTGLELVDSYTPAEPETELTAIGLNTEQVDYTLNHIAAVSPAIELIQLESEPRSEDSDAAVDKLVSEGKTIITVE